MFGRIRLGALAAPALTLAAWLFAAFIVVGTLRAVVPPWSPLPWLDEWSSVSLLRSWQAGDMTAAAALFAPANEHRIAVPRLAFLADALLFRGGGRLTLGCIFAVQALHAGVFAAVLGRARPGAAGRWAVAAAILALMFSLRQEENFSYGFQLQFVGVFAGATLSFALLGWATARARSGRAPVGPLLAGFVAALLTAFTMANGLLAAWVLAALAAAARLGARAVLLCAAWAAAVTAAYLWDYHPYAPHARPSDGLAHPLGILVYAAAYLGGVASEHSVAAAAALGFAGIALAASAAGRAARFGAGPAPLAMVGVMLFVGATAAATALGRLEFGAGQALSSRYATGSIAFWSAQLAYWWIDPPRPARLPRLPGAARGAVLALAAALCLAVAGEQGRGRARMAEQSFLQNESADLLMLGLDDPAVVERAAWSDAEVRRLLPTLKADGLSIFGTADYAGLGRPVGERGALGPPCAGAVETAVADPALGQDGVRVSGRALDGGRIVRRILLADGAGRAVGLATGAVPGAARGAWRGFAVAAPGAELEAYGLLDGARLCPIGRAAVVAR